MKSYNPRPQPASRVFAVILSLGLVGVSVLAGRELWTKRTGTELESWLTPVFETIGEAKFQPWMLPAGIISLIVGIVLIVIAFKPRAKTHRKLASAPNHWIRNVDIARQCTATTERVPGVSRASTYASRKSVTVTVSGNTRDPELQQRVIDAVIPITAQLAEVPKLSVKLQTKGDEAL